MTVKTLLRNVMLFRHVLINTYICLAITINFKAIFKLNIYTDLSDWLFMRSTKVIWFVINFYI